MSHPILQLEDFCVAYRTVEAVHGVRLQVNEGEIVTVIGPNGAGKTTLLCAAMGLLQSTGQLMLDGERIARPGVETMVARGVALVPERRELFGEMSVEDNLLLGGFYQWRKGKRDQRARMDEIFEIFPRLKERRPQMASTLSGGERQMLAIGRALMTNPDLLILDEATEGLAPVIREEIWNCIATLKAEGEAILVVDKYVQRLLPLANRHVILERGRVVWQGDSAALDADRSLWTRYLGV